MEHPEPVIPTLLRSLRLRWLRRARPAVLVIGLLDTSAAMTRVPHPEVVFRYRLLAAEARRGVWALVRSRMNGAGAVDRRERGTPGFAAEFRW